MVQHAIPIDGLDATDRESLGTYPMEAYGVELDGRELISAIHVDIENADARRIDTFDIGHSINNRIRREAGSAMSRQGWIRNPEPSPTSNISIKRALDVVNGIF